MKTSLALKTTRFIKFGIFVLQAAAVVTALLEAYRKAKVFSHTTEKKAPDLTPKFAGGKRDIIDETSWESFPASDPPSWSKAKT